MYMGSKGLPMHSPRSPVYGETLVHCIRAVYPPRFLWTIGHRWACVFLWLWLGHVYMGSKSLPMCSPQRLFYNKTLARCTCVVYPLDFSGRWLTGGLVSLFCFS
jgi:hypothetical protein